MRAWLLPLGMSAFREDSRDWREWHSAMASSDSKSSNDSADKVRRKTKKQPQTTLDFSLLSEALASSNDQKSASLTSDQPQTSSPFAFNSTTSFAPSDIFASLNSSGSTMLDFGAFGSATQPSSTATSSSSQTNTTGELALCSAEASTINNFVFSFASSLSTPETATSVQQSSVASSPFSLDIQSLDFTAFNNAVSSLSTTTSSTTTTSSSFSTIQPSDSKTSNVVSTPQMPMFNSDIEFESELRALASLHHTDCSANDEYYHRLTADDDAEVLQAQRSKHQWLQIYQLDQSDRSGPTELLFRDQSLSFPSMYEAASTAAWRGQVVFVSKHAERLRRIFASAASQQLNNLAPIQRLSTDITFLLWSFLTSDDAPNLGVVCSKWTVLAMVTNNCLCSLL